MRLGEGNSWHDASSPRATCRPVVQPARGTLRAFPVVETGGRVMKPERHRQQASEGPW